MSEKNGLFSNSKILSGISVTFPGFFQTLLPAIRKGWKESEGVLQICHLPSIAPEAYLHTFYPPCEDPDGLWREQFIAPLPKPLIDLYTFTNGATLFHNLVEISGFIVNGGKHVNPAYDIRVINHTQSQPSWIVFAVNCCGDERLINTHSGFIKALSPIKGDTKTFDNLESWLEYETGVAYEVLDEVS